MAFIKTYKVYIKRVAIVWATFMVLVVLVYVIVLGPQSRDNKRLENALAEKKQMYDLALRAAQEQTKLRLNKEIEQLRERLNDFVIDFEHSGNLTFDIGQIANEKKVGSFSIKNNKRRGAIAIPDYELIREDHIDVGFTAGFNQFAAFVNELERHRPVLFVHEFEINHSNQNASAYEVTLDVATLVRKPQDRQTAVDKPAEQSHGAKI